MIRCERVTFAYGRDGAVPVLRDLTLTIAPGEELAVMGGNGCGKSTLGLLLTGILRPTSGRIIIAGIDAGDGGDQQIGFLFQDPDNGLVATTVEREVAFSLENRNTPSADIRRVVEHTLQQFAMISFRQRLVWNLSGGEKQRLALAALFAAGSRLLFLDEAESFLDYQGACRLEEMLGEMKTADPALTVIRVTQYARVAEQYRRVVIMADGGVIGDGPPDTVFSQPAIMAKSGLRPPLKYLTPKSKGVPPVADSEEKPCPPPLMEIDELSFSYDTDQAKMLLEGLSLTIGQGEVLALVGASGSGKSTLAQILCGLYPATAGSIRFMKSPGRAIMSFQQSERQFFLETAFDEVAYGIRRRYVDPDKLAAAVRAAMEIAGLDYDRFSGRDPHTLSGGEARRLAFAIVVALDADLIIFDEPTCGLDATGIDRFQTLVNRLKQSGRTVILISHNSDIIAELADVVAVLSEGKITTMADPRTFFDSPEAKGLLSVPEVIHYQRERFGAVYTTRLEAILRAGQINP